MWKDFRPTVTEQELRDLFSECGTVLSIQMATTVEGRSLGFATLEMGTAEAVEQAIRTLHHVELGGSILLVYRSTQVSANGWANPEATQPLKTPGSIAPCF